MPWERPKPGEPEEELRQPRPRARWEYCELHLTTATIYRTTGREAIEMEPPTGPDPGGSVFDATVVPAVAQLGLEGWELVSAFFESERTRPTRWIFKRPIA